MTSERDIPLSIFCNNTVACPHLPCLQNCCLSLSHLKGQVPNLACPQLHVPTSGRKVRAACHIRSKGDIHLSSFCNQSVAWPHLPLFPFTPPGDGSPSNLGPQRQRLGDLFPLARLKGMRSLSPIMEPSKCSLPAMPIEYACYGFGATAPVAAGITGVWTSLLMR